MSRIKVLPRRAFLVLGVLVHGAIWTVAPAFADIVIGVAAPATARHAALAADVARGVSEAVEKLNASGGLNGQHVIIVSADDACDGDRAKDAARRLIEAKPAAVIGHPCAAAAIAAAPLYAAAKVPFFAIGVRHPSLTDKRAGPFVFRLAGRDDRQGAAAAAALLAAAPNKNIAIIQDRTAYARTVLADTTAHLIKAGAPTPTVLPIVAGKRDYPNEIAKLVAARPEAVLFAGYPSEATVILSAMRKAGLSSVLIGSDALATPEFADTISEADRAGQRVRVLSPGDDMGVTTTGAQSSPMATLASAAVQALAAAAAKSNSVDPEALAQSLSAASLGPTEIGQLTFEDNGDARLPSFVASVLVAGRWQSPSVSQR